MRVAALDVGTNTVRLLIADVTPGVVGPILRRSTITRLGQGVDGARILHRDAIARTLAALGDYRAEIARHDVQRVGGIATSAVRDASNGAEFLVEATAALGAAVGEIDGDTEAVLSFAGATATLPFPPPYTLIDLGGGSTEFTHGGTDPDVAVSVDMGSVRLTERCLGNGPIEAARLDAARAEARRTMSAVTIDAAGTVVGVGGTFTALSAFHLGLPIYDPVAVHMSSLSVADLSSLVDTLAPMTTSEIAAVPSMEPARAPVALGGAVVAEQAVALLGTTRVLVSEIDILDGFAAELAGRT